MADRELTGLMKAHHILFEFSQTLPKPKWWQRGFARSCHETATLNALSDRLFDEIQRRMPHSEIQPNDHTR